MDTLTSRHTTTIHILSILSAMKRFIIKSSLTIVIPVVSFLVAYEISMRSIPNDYSFKSALWEKKAREIKVLVLGSSHCYYGFDPIYFSKTAFNAANVSQTYNYDWFLFNKYFDRMDSLEYVVLPISSFSPYSKTENRRESWRCKEYAIHYGCDFHKWYEIKYRYHFAYLSIGNILQAISRLSNGNYHHIYVDSNGYSKRTATDRIDDIEQDGITAAIRHTIDIEKCNAIFHENSDYVRDMVTRCQKRGIKVLFVSTPTLPEYYTHLNPKQVQKMEDFGRSMEQYENVRYINLLKSSLFDTNDFFNSDHLCDKGAKKLTTLINNTINEWDSIPQRNQITLEKK